MENDDLIRMWNAIEVPAVSDAEIREMVRPHNQPVLKRVRRQLILEISFFILFAGVYYSCFDDGGINIYPDLLLLTGFALFVFHDLLVYRYYQLPKKGTSIPAMLRHSRNRLRGMTAITVLFRGSATFLLICFFSSAMKLDAGTIWTLRIGATSLIMQVAFNIKTWLLRLRHVVRVLSKYLPVNVMLDDDEDPSQGLDKFSRR